MKLTGLREKGIGDQSVYIPRSLLAGKVSLYGPCFTVSFAARVCSCPTELWVGCFDRCVVAVKVSCSCVYLVSRLSYSTDPRDGVISSFRWIPPFCFSLSINTILGCHGEQWKHRLGRNIRKSLDSLHRPSSTLSPLHGLAGRVGEGLPSPRDTKGQSSVGAETCFTR